MTTDPCVICALAIIYDADATECAADLRIIPALADIAPHHGAGATLRVCRTCHPQVTRYGDAIAARRDDTVRYPVCGQHSDSARGITAAAGLDGDHPHAAHIRHYHWTCRRPAA